MKPPVLKSETRASARPERVRPTLLRPKTLLQWLLERLCAYPSAD
jgi:hypothetical protein